MTRFPVLTSTSPSDAMLSLSMIDESYGSSLDAAVVVLNDRCAPSLSPSPMAIILATE